MFFRRKSRTNPPAAPVAPAPTPIPVPSDDISGLGRALWRRKTKIIGLTLGAAAVAFLVVNSITPRYRSEARILLESKENVFLRAEADKQNMGDRTTLDAEAVASQIQLVLSRDLARHVIAKEKLTEHTEFDGSGGFGKALLGMIGMLRSR